MSKNESQSSFQMNKSVDNADEDDKDFVEEMNSDLSDGEINNNEIQQENEGSPAAQDQNDKLVHKKTEIQTKKYENDLEKVKNIL